MRAMLLAVMLTLGGCEAIDDFHFRFDGGAATSDGGSGLATFGEACQANQCQQYGPQRPVSCLMSFTMNGNDVTFPDGMCSRACTPGVGACTDYGIGVADCVQIDNLNVCAPHCNPTAGQGCRIGYSCCVNSKPTSGPGLCVPAKNCN